MKFKCDATGDVLEIPEKVLEPDMQPLSVRYVAAEKIESGDAVMVDNNGQLRRYVR
jgi:hypothetical protein